MKANKSQLEQYPKCQPILEGVTELSGGALLFPLLFFALLFFHLVKAREVTIQHVTASQRAHGGVVCLCLGGATACFCLELHVFLLGCYAVDAHSSYLPRGLIGTAGPESMHLTIERKCGIINTVQIADWSNRAPAVVVYLPIGKWLEVHIPLEVHNVFSVSVSLAQRILICLWPVGFKSESLFERVPPFLKRFICVFLLW
jgi:hypothetical protein